MDDTTDVLRRVTDALRWAMPYAERGHEDMYPMETYERDGYVASSVAEARAALAAAEAYIQYVKGE